MSQEPVFRAYVSYSHQDEQFAAWFHRALENWKLPNRLAEEYGRKNLRPVFRDRSDLSASANLSESLNDAINKSEALIVICSKHSAASKWVNEEIKSFRQQKGNDRIFAIICDDGPPDCFPPALLQDDAGNNYEPIAADARTGFDGRNDALLKTIAALLDVRFDDLKRRELRRQYRNMTIAASVSAAIAVVTIGLALAAYDARNDANRQREQAENLISFMVGDLRSRLEAVGRLDVLDAVGDKSLSYFASLEDDELTPGTLLRRAQAVRQIGEVRMSQGKMLEAQEAFIVSNNQARQILDRHENPAEVRFELSQSHFYIGYVHYEQGDLDAAREQFEGYLIEATRLLEMEPDNESYLIEVSYAHSNLGSLELKANRPDEARNHFAATAAIQKQQMDAKPNELQPIKDYVETVSWLGEMATDTVNALEYFRQEYELRQRIVEREDNKIQEERLGDALTLLAYEEMMLGNLADSEKHWREAHNLSSELVRYDEENIRWLRQKTYSQLGLGTVGMLAGDLEGLEDILQDARAGCLEILSRNPKAESAQLDYVHSLLQLAKLRKLSSKPYAAFVKEARRFVVEEGNLRPSATSVTILGQLYVLSGDIQRTAGNEEAATREWTSGLEVMTGEFRIGSVTRNIIRILTEAALLGRLGDTEGRQRVLGRLSESGLSESQLNRLMAIVVYGERSEGRSPARLTPEGVL